MKHYKVKTVNALGYVEPRNWIGQEKPKRSESIRESKMGSISESELESKW